MHVPKLNREIIFAFLKEIFFMSGVFVPAWKLRPLCVITWDFFFTQSFLNYAFIQMDAHYFGLSEAEAHIRFSRLHIVLNPDF